MTLIKSISGFRGTIGGRANESLTPIDIAKSVSAYAALREHVAGRKYRRKIIIGRDARMSGEMVSHVVCGTLLGMGFDVVNIGIATTPTVEIATKIEKACGGIIITASHNQKQWNALKFLNERGEFLPPEEASEIVRMANTIDFEFADTESLGCYTKNYSYDQRHIHLIKGLELVDTDAIARAHFNVVIDGCNSVGGIIVPKLLGQLGVTQVTQINCEATGDFSHNPEPLKENLTEIRNLMRKGRHDIGFVVDPDVDRLALVCEDGSMFGEENTLVAVADYVLRHTPGNTVSNLSSTRGLRDITEKYHCNYTPAAVGEVNVVTKMRETGAVIGGEGNGGVIYPPAHMGRDALVGIALILTHLAKTGMRATELRDSLPQYFISKNRIDLDPKTDIYALLQQVKAMYQDEQVTDIDGIKIDFANKWVHLRKSNTEPIIRVIAEAHTREEANALSQQMMDLVYSLTNK